MKASELKPGDVLVNKVFNAEPTRIAEVVVGEWGVADSVAVRFACQEDWCMLNAAESVEIL